MADYVLSGSTPDAFVLLEVKSRWGYDQGRTATIKDSYAPEWTAGTVFCEKKEAKMLFPTPTFCHDFMVSLACFALSFIQTYPPSSFLFLPSLLFPLLPSPSSLDGAKATHDLLVEDLATASLEITVRDENRLGKDTVIGKASIPPSLLPALHENWTGWLPLKEEGKEKERGHIELSVQVLPAVGEGEGIELSESAAAGATTLAANGVGGDDDEEDDEVGREEGQEGGKQEMRWTNACLIEFILPPFFSTLSRVCRRPRARRPTSTGTRWLRR